MSQKRQAPVFDRLRDKRSHIATLMHDYPTGHVIPLHFHDRDQIVYASQGVMTVVTSAGTWVVPTLRALWVPAGVPHTVTMSGRVAMRTLYLKPTLARALPRDCCVVNVSPLLRELILYACSFHALSIRVPRQRHLIDLITDQLEAVHMVPLRLPRLSDPRARHVAQILVADPTNTQQLAQLCSGSGASKRTIERLFQDEVGMSFGKWRQQLRLMHAMRLLAEGAKVTYVALEAGYSTPSAFICAFKKVLGLTPALYFKAGA